MSNANPYHIVYRITAINIGVNIIGAALTTFYFAYLDSGVLHAPAWQPIITVIFSVIMTFALLVIGSLATTRFSKPLFLWLGRLSAGQSPEDVPESIRRQVLELPLLNAANNLLLWLLAGFFIGLLSSLDHFFNWNSFLRSFFGTTVISGVTTTVLIFFAVERIWKAAYPSFFPGGDVTQTGAVRMSVRWRLLILFVVGSMPLFLLAVISFNVTAQIAVTPQPLELLLSFRRQETFIIGVSIIGTVMLASTLGKSLVEPLDRLGRQMSAVQSGDLDARLAASSNDEYGQLIAGFNAMLEGLRQEEVIRRMFGRYVTPQVADYAIQHGAEPGGQVVQASVLFTDIRDFTGLTERVEPSALIDMLNRYFETMASVIGAHGGLVNKFGGDSMLALFGSPLNPDAAHVQQAVQAAQGLLAALDGFNRIQRARGEATLEIGVGVATGAVVVGNVGSRERLEYTALGDTVNLAARLQALTRSLDRVILLDETTALGIRSDLELEAMGPVNIRGKAEPEQVYACRPADLQ